MRIYDTFLFAGIGTELDMLECHLRELEDVNIYRHVIVEGSRTFQGDPKPLHFMENRERFAPWKDRIRYISIDPSAEVPGKEPGEAWAREHASRTAAWMGLEDARSGDLILHGDVDEIPMPDLIDSLHSRQDFTLPCKVGARFFMYAVDWAFPLEWTAPSICRFDQLESIGGFTPLRESHSWPMYPHVRPGAWHFCNLGGDAALLQKVHSFSHAEAIPEVEAGVAKGTYLTEGQFWTGIGRERETKLQPEDVDPSWPYWIWQRECPEVWFRPRDAA